MQEPELGTLLAERARHRPRAERGCPESEVLAAHAAGELDPSPREQLLAHVDGCPDCAAELAAAAAIRDLVAGTRGWRFALGRDSTRWLAFAAATAAAALIAAFAGWTLGSRTATREDAVGMAASLAGGTPRSTLLLNVPIVDLEAPTVLRGDPAPAIQLSRSAGWATLLLHPQHETPEAGWAVEVVGPNGEPLARALGLKRGRDGELALGLSLATLPLGRLQLRLVPPAGPAEAFHFLVGE
jgi:hypothetical protein